MKPCPHCGRQIPEDSAFCPYCMERLASKWQVKQVKEKHCRGQRTVTVLLLVIVLALAGILLTVLWGRSSGKGNVQELRDGLENREQQASESPLGKTEDYQDYLGTWDTIQDGSYIRVVVEIAEGRRVSGRAELESLSSGRVSSILFSGEVDEGGRLSCAFSDDGWGAYGNLTVEFMDGRIHLITEETGYSEGYTGEWSIGNIDVWLEQNDE